MKISYRALFLLVLAFSFFASPIADAAPQKRPRRPVVRTEPVSPVVGKDIRITRVDGSEIVGKFVRVDMREVVYENSVGEKIPIPLENVAVLAIGETPKPQVDTRFIADAQATVDAINRLAEAVEKDLTYGEYVPQVTDAKVAVESFVAKYSNYLDQKPLFDLMRKIIRSYELASPIWAKRSGVDQRKSLAEDSAEIQAILAVYPQLKTTEYNQGGRYATDKVIAWVWSQAARQTRDLRDRSAKLYPQN